VGDNENEKQNIKLTELKILVDLNSKRLDGHSKSLDEFKRSLYGYNGNIGMVGVAHESKKAINEMQKSVDKLNNRLLISILTFVTAILLQVVFKFI